MAQLVKNPSALWEAKVQSLGREDSPGEGSGHPLQYSGLVKSMDCIVHGVTKSQTQLSDFHFTSLLMDIGAGCFFFFNLFSASKFALRLLIRCDFNPM